MITFDEETNRNCFNCIHSALKPYGLWCEARHRRVHYDGVCEKWNDYPNSDHFLEQSETR